ncbi:MAG TPA: SIMPL domain-containing protein [Phycisphaerales bacterium]|nr:SIMPL domain-containing protein [Phycisphaerales bacterium]
MNLKAVAAVALIGASLIGTPGGTPAFAQQPAAAQRETGTVSATATARVMRAPDYLDVHLGVETISDTAQDAQAKCTATMEATLAALQKLGLEKYEPQTGTVTLAPRYTEQYRSLEERKIIGYTATNTVRVRTTDLKATARVIDAALKAGANRVDGISFGIREYLAAREEALAMAAKAAKRKAEVLAGALDLALGRVVALTESSPRYYGGVANRMAQVQMENVATGSTPGDESVVPGQIEVVVDVTVSFEVEKK